MSDFLTVLRRIDRSDTAGEAVGKACSAEEAYAAELADHYSGLQTLIGWLTTHPQSDADVKRLFAAGFTVHDPGSARVPASLEAGLTEAMDLVEIVTFDRPRAQERLGVGWADDILLFARAVVAEARSLERACLAHHSVQVFAAILAGMAWSAEFFADHPDHPWALDRPATPPANK